MSKLSETTFICLDCEMTGLDAKVDRIIEVAVAKFTLKEIFEQYETLINPGCIISKESIAIHNITDEMVAKKPLIKEILPRVFSMAGDHILVGHGIGFDIEVLREESKRAGLDKTIGDNIVIDTLRLARLYGGSPVNSLAYLRKHFNVEEESAHRAMGDVIVNIQVFAHLIKKFKTTEELLEALSKPILLPFMPLGKHKGRKFKEIPQQYLEWAGRKDFDQDLLHSIRTELKRRRQGQNFKQAANPFSEL